MSNEENHSPSMQQQKALLERFYYSGWNKNDESVLLDCLHEKVRFRLPVGGGNKKKVGAQSVVDHMKDMHRVLGRHVREIEELVVTEEKCAARIKCSGIHQKEFFGQPGTGTELTWYNACFFTIQNGKITEIWALGDIDSLKGQLGADQDASPF